MKIKTTTTIAAALLAMAACSDDDIKTYDTSQTDSVFFNYINSDEETDSAVTYNFGYEITRVHVVNIPVNLMGMPKDQARNISLQVVADSTTMTEGVNYTIDRHEIAANAVQDTVKISLLRDGDSSILTQAKRLRLQIVANDELRPTGQNTFDITYSDIRPTSQPSWWNDGAGVSIPEYSFENVQLFFEYFYRLAPQANRTVFNEIVARYGDYFVNAVRQEGPFSMYGVFLTRYVLIPMYDDTNETVNWPSGRPTVNPN